MCGSVTCQCIRHYTTMRYFFTVIALMTSIAVYSQNDVFTVKKSINIYPDIDTLLGGKAYTFTVTGISMRSVAHISFSEGKVQKTDSGFIVTVNQSVSPKKKYAIQLFTSGGSGLKEVAGKEVTLWPMALPKFDPAALRGVPVPPAVYWFNSSDKFSSQLPVADTISLEKAHGKQNSIFVISASNVDYTVISFRLLVGCGGAIKEFFARGRIFTPEMEAYMATITKGCTISFADVKYVRNSGTADESIAGPFKMVVQ